MNFLKCLARNWNDSDTVERVLTLFISAALVFLATAIVMASDGIALVVVIAFILFYKAIDKFFNSFEDEDQ